MVDPVFVDTSEGRAVVADSVNTKVDNIPITSKTETRETVVPSLEKNNKKNKEHTASEDEDEGVSSEVEVKSGIYYSITFLTVLG